MCVRRKQQFAYIDVTFQERILSGSLGAEERPKMHLQHGQHLTGLYIQTGSENSLAMYFFKARDCQPFLSPFLGN